MASKTRRQNVVRVGAGHPRRVRRAYRLAAVVTALLLALQWLLAGSTIEAVLGLKPQRVLVVTAHPDDEVMFFAPVILALVALGAEVHALCLSVGNAEGFGATRSQELVESYGILGVPAHRVQSVDDKQLQDGMDVRWDPEYISSYIEAQGKASGSFDMILTFDGHGISGHANHAACFEAASRLVEAGHSRAFALRSVSIAQKFLGLPHALVRHALRSRGHEIESASFMALSTPRQYLQSLQAMTQHRSQLVWFRYLYVVFSTYMYGAAFDEIRSDSTQTFKQPIR